MQARVAQSKYVPLPINGEVAGALYVILLSCGHRFEGDVPLSAGHVMDCEECDERGEP